MSNTDKGQVKKLEKKQFIVLVILVLLVSVSTCFALFKASLNETKLLLETTVKSNVRMIESIYAHEKIISSDTARAITIAQFISAYTNFHEELLELGESFEFLLGERDGEYIRFIVKHAQEERSHQGTGESILAQINDALPMNMALDGESGYIIGSNHDGHEVLAVYRAMPELQLGIVAKIRTEEIRQPFLQTGIFVTIFAIIVAYFFHKKMFSPLYRSLILGWNELETAIVSRTSETTEALSNLKLSNSHLAEQMEARLHSENVLKAELATSSSLVEVIQYTLRDGSAREILLGVLDILMRIEWLRIVKKGAIFLYTDKENALQMKAQIGLSTAVLRECNSVQLGVCLCGRAGLTQKPLHKSHCDDDHDVRYDGMLDHGHYCIPIVCNGTLMGVLNLYLEAGHEKNEREVEFLTSVSSVLAGLVKRKNQEGDRLKYERAVQGNNSGVAFISSEWLITYANEAFLRMFGNPDMNDVLGRHFEELQDGITEYNGEFYEGMRKVLGQTGIWKGEMKCRGRDGRHFFAHIIIQPLQDDHNEQTIYTCGFRDISGDRDNEKRMREMTLRDSLTGVHNRLAFDERLHQCTLKVTRGGQQTHAVMYIDLDEFKKVNDELGHSAGDQLIKTATERMRAIIRDTDTLARLGGDEFAVILIDIKTADVARRTAIKIIESLSEVFELEEGKASIGCSIGISVFPKDGGDVQALVKAADTAMYSAKMAGRGQYRFASKKMIKLNDALNQLERDMKTALDAGDQFFLEWQPKICLRSGEIVGAEALIRWNHPTRGLVNPGDFIPVAEGTDMIITIGWWVLNEVVRQGSEWISKGLPPLKISANLSPRQFQGNELASRVKEALSRHGYNPEYLELEITETTVASNINRAVRQMYKVTELGVVFSLDDFGTGYSSLTQLRELPVRVLKIDRSFIMNNNTVMMESIVALAHKMGLSVIAEGVEKPDQLLWLRSIGCDEAQGYFCGKPLSAIDFADLLSRQPNPMECFILDNQ